jgi:hypothetical protein
MSECGDADGSAPPSDTETLETALTESRRTFDKSVDRLEEIDDKAMRSVRTAVLLAGLVASAISLGGPDSMSELGLLPVITGAVGVISLGASIVVGIGVYAVTEYPYGVRNAHRASPGAGEHTYGEWLVTLLDAYDTWSDELQVETTRTIAYLEFIQFTLGLAVVTLLVSSSKIVLEASYGTEPLVTFVVALLVGGLIVIWNKFVIENLYWG